MLVDDYGNDASTSGILSLSGDTYSGTINYSNDQDWLRIELAAGTQYNIDADGNSLRYPHLRIWDSNNQVVASSSTDNYQARLNFTPEPTMSP